MNRDLTRTLLIMGVGTILVALFAPTLVKFAVAAWELLP